MTRSTLFAALIVAMAGTVGAQPPGGPPNGPPQGGPPQGGPPQGGPPRGGPPGFHLMPALDTNRDGKLSSEEIANAVSSLAKLDKNKDGKLSAEEIGWPPAGFGRGGPGGFGGDRPQGRPDGRPPRELPSFFPAKHLRALDRNKDGKVERQEIPRRLQTLILDRVDTDKSGVLETSELDALEKEQAAAAKKKE